MITPEKREKIQRKINNLAKSQQLEPGDAIALFTSFSLSIMSQLYQQSFDDSKRMMAAQLLESCQSNGLAVMPDPEPELTPEQRLDQAKFGSKPIDEEEAMRRIEEGSRPPEGAN